MFVYSCFDGDDLEVAWVQHDLYFGREVPTGYGIAGRYYTLGWWWRLLLDQAERRRSAIPWFDRNLRQLEKSGNFSHKLLQLPHEHIAAYYRWCRLRDGQRSATCEKDARRLELLAGWRDWIAQELKTLLDSDAIALACSKVILYRHFDASDRWGEALDAMLVERYGFECVAKTWRSRDPVMLAARSGRQVHALTHPRGHTDPGR